MPEIQICECCGQKVSKTRRRIERSMISALLKAVDYCNKLETNIFFKRNVALNPVEYTLITFLVKFGLLYKTEEMKAGEFGIPIKRVSDFMKGEWRVAEYYETNPLLKEGDEGFRIMSENRISISEIPKHSELIAEHEHTIEYIDNNFK